MKKFKEYIQTDQADVARAYMELNKKGKEGKLNDFDEAKKKAMTALLTKKSS